VDPIEEDRDPYIQSLDVVFAGQEERMKMGAVVEEIGPPFLDS
jgi:hypothetical protein